MSIEVNKTKKSLLDFRSSDFQSFPIDCYWEKNTRHHSYRLSKHIHFLNLPIIQQIAKLLFFPARIFLDYRDRRYFSTHQTFFEHEMIYELANTLNRTKDLRINNEEITTLELESENDNNGWEKWLVPVKEKYDFIASRVGRRRAYEMMYYHNLIIEDLSFQQFLLKSCCELISSKKRIRKLSMVGVTPMGARANNVNVSAQRCQGRINDLQLLLAKGHINNNRQTLYCLKQPIQFYYEVDFAYGKGKIYLPKKMPSIVSADRD